MITLFSKIFRTIWAIWSGLVFISLVCVVFFPVIIPVLFFGKRGMRFGLFIMIHFLSPAVLFFMGVFPRVHGKQNIEKGRGYVIVSNHTSQLDIILNPATYRMPNLFQFLSKIEVTKVPVFGFLVKKMAVLVDRKSPESRRKTYLHMKKVLQNGTSMILYPEGTRNRTIEPLQPFHDGAFKLAVDLQTPILVQTLVGAGKLSDPKRVIDMRPGIVDCYWDKPIETQGMGDADIPMLKEKVREIMLTHLLKK